ncbi:MAG: DUF3052 domain-containing protein [Dehalococcoidia bacterium]
MAGYSGTPLPKKLGIKEGSRCAFIGAPPGFSESLGELPAEATVDALSPGAIDVAVFFTTDRAELAGALPGLGEGVFPAGGLWIAWPKKAAKVATDLTEDVLREVILPTGLVDNKVCAIDERWSGLRFVWRKELRGGPGPPPR